MANITLKEIENTLNTTPFTKDISITEILGVIIPAYQSILNKKHWWSKIPPLRKKIEKDRLAKIPLPANIKYLLQEEVNKRKDLMKSAIAIMEDTIKTIDLDIINIKKQEEQTFEFNEKALQDYLDAMERRKNKYTHIEIPIDFYSIPKDRLITVYNQHRWSIHEKLLTDLTYKLLDIGIKKNNRIMILNAVIEKVKLDHHLHFE
jgi:hypothetical protein